MLMDTRNLILALPRMRPRIFRRNLEKLIFEFDNSVSVGNRLSDAATHIVKDADIDWDVIEQVGLSGPMLELKSDLLYQAMRKKKPDGEIEELFRSGQSALTYPESKPIWGGLFRYLKSLLGSLMEAVKEGTKLKYILDFIKEYIECLDASVKFVQGAKEAEG
jgi:hypothetical protein